MLTLDTIIGAFQLSFQNLVSLLDHIIYHDMAILPNCAIRLMLLDAGIQPLP